MSARPLFVLLVVGALLGSAGRALGQERRGFTALFTMGYGLQWYSGDGPKESALAGPNIGIGGFVSPSLALMVRTSGTYRHYTYPTANGEYDNNIISGTVTADAQWWVTRNVNIELGAGLGVLSYSYGNTKGYGLLAGIGYSLWSREAYGLQVGVEFAPFFKDSSVIRNLGFNVGFQFF